MAGGGGGGRGGLGWAVLAAALAVPGFLFYNWWSHLKAEHDHLISAKASKRADGEMFQTPPQTERLINPMAPSTGAPAGFPLAAAAAGLPRTTADAMPVAAAVSAVILSTSSTIVLPRDPMISPLDAVRLQEAAMAEEERLRALAEANRPHAPRHARAAPIESRIELQGIVAKADGDNLAIINGSTVGPGESISIDNYPGKVRILKITASEVTLDYKGRKFKMGVNAE